jgi:hypothetical protein
MNKSTLIKYALSVGTAGALVLSAAATGAAAPVLSNTAVVKAASADHATDVRWRGGWGGWRGGGWRGGGALAAGIIGGLALGAIASAPYSYGYGPGYGYAPYGYGYSYAPTYYGYYGAPAYYGYAPYGYSRQRPW